MLPARKRLSLRRDPDFFSRAKRFYTPSLVVYVEYAQNTKGAVVVSKKAAASLVERNRLKRVTSQVLAALLDRLPPMHVVVVIKKGTHRLSMHQIYDEVSTLFPDGSPIDN